jgi:hypothetical protein
MQHLFTKFELRALSSMIAAVILLGSFSLTAGVIIVSGPTHPEITVSICQPLQASCITTMTLLARPAPAAPSGFALYDRGPIAVGTLTQMDILPADPDTPPPKQLG